MITIEVRLDNDFDVQYQNIEITREELKQFACNKAKGMYMDGYWTNIKANDEIILKSTL